MRTSLFAMLLLLFTAMVARAQQQIPNGSFENRIFTEYQADVPAGAAGMRWVSGDSLMFLRCGWSQQPQVAKVTDAHSGQYALCLQESFYVAPVGGNVVQENGGGYISLGVFDTNSFMPVGVPYTERPSALTGFYKLTADTAGADSANIRIGFKNAGFLIGQGGQLFYTNTNTWQPFTIPINWSNNQYPNKLMLDMAVGSTDLVCSDTSTRFYLDDLSFLLANGIRENLFANAHISVFPNPATDMVHIQLDDPYLGDDCFITVHDAAGKAISKSGHLQKEQVISLRGQGSGTYFIQLRKGGETVYGTRITVVQ